MIDFSHFIAADGAIYIQQAYTNATDAQNALPEMQRRHPDKVMRVRDDWETFWQEAEASFFKPAEKIDAARWDEMLGMLPPLGWRTVGGVERFCCSEFTYGGVTHQFARLHEDGRDLYATKPVRYRDSSTFITADEIRAVNAEVPA